MSAIPLVFYFEGEFVCKLVGSDTDHTISQLVDEAKQFSVDVHVPDQPGKQIKVKRQDSDEVLNPNATIAEVGLIPLETVQMYFE